MISVYIKPILIPSLLAEPAESRQFNPKTRKGKAELNCAMKCNLLLHKSSFAAHFCPERAAARREETIPSLWKQRQQLAGPREPRTSWFQMQQPLSPWPAEGSLAAVITSQLLGKFTNGSNVPGEDRGTSPFTRSQVPSGGFSPRVCWAAQTL